MAKDYNPSRRNREAFEALAETPGNVPPQAVELEEAVLGALMLEKDSIIAVQEYVTPDAFYTEEHRTIYKAIEELSMELKPIDLYTVTERLKGKKELKKVGGASYLAQLTQKVGSAANVEFHAKIIAQKYVQRELIRSATEIQKRSYDESTDVTELIGYAEGEIFKVAEGHVKRSVQVSKDILARALMQIEEASKNTSAFNGVPSGFMAIDRVTLGWQLSDLIIIAARPSMGKTAFVLSMARNMAVDHEQGVAFFSLEMSSVQLMMRLIIAETGLNGNDVKSGRLTPEQWRHLESATKPLGAAPLFIDDTPALSVFEFRSKARRLKIHNDIKIIIIDYLQLMTGNQDSKGNREQEVAFISRTLKAIAKELNAYSFYLEVLSLNEPRKKLANGKPCPLCGAIHHPYSVKLPFDRSLEDKLAKAKEDAQLALVESEKCKAEFAQLQLQQTEAENILNTLTTELNEAKGEILYIASELNIVGLREKKPITWAAVLKQKQTSLANRRDDLEARLEKIQGLTEAIESLKEKREDAALKTARKKEEQASLEEALKNFANMSAELEKNQKDSELNRVSLTRLLERAFARFGLKASNPAIMKQNLPTLEKRREQWINWSVEKKQIEEETAESEEALRNTVASLTAQKKSAETLEKDIEALTEQIKRFQKERHEAIASQTPEEVIAAIETEKANATRLAEEAKLSLASKEEALLSTQNKINTLEAHRSETIKSIESLSDAFNQKLQKAGFPNESSFLSSQISTAQKDDLMRQNDELLERYRVVNSQYEEKQQALNSLQEKNLTTRTREQLEEELLEKSDLFHTATAQLTGLREKMAKNANNKNRRKREEAEFQKLQTSLERWESLCANAEEPGGIARLGLSLAVAYGSSDIDAFIPGAKIKLRDEGVKLFAPELSDASGLAGMKTISADQRFFVALSLLLGRSELFARRSKPEFVILKQNQNEAFPSQTFTGLESLNLTIGVAR